VHGSSVLREVVLHEHEMASHSIPGMHITELGTWMLPLLVSPNLPLIKHQIYPMETIIVKQIFIRII
jgi:hypothetical protein